MSRLILAVGGIAVLAASALAEDPQSQLSKEISLPSNIGFAANVSSDAQVATVLFDDMYVEVAPTQAGALATHNQTAIATKTATLSFPFKSSEESVTMTLDVRGFADVDDAAIPRLVVCVGDKTQVVDIAANGQKQAKEVELKGKLKAQLLEQNPNVQYGDWESRIQFTAPVHASKPVLQVTLFLLVERDADTADAGGALLVVDSLDLAIRNPQKAK